MTNKDLLLAFIIGSSIVSTFISFTYIGRANWTTKGIEHYEVMPFGISIIFGLFNMLNVYLISTYKLNYNYSLLIGGLQGLVLSTIGRFAMGNLPVKMFQFTTQNVGMVHIYAFIFYALIFRFVVNYFNHYFGLI